MLITIRHKMTVSFGEAPPRALLHLLLTPRDGPMQTVREWTVHVDGDARSANLTDAFGNSALCVSLTEPGETVDVSVEGVVETRESNGILGWPEGDPVPGLFRRITPDTRSPVSVWGKYRNEAADPSTHIDILHGLMERIHEMFSDADSEEKEPEQAKQTQSLGSGQSQSQSQGGQHQSMDGDGPETEDNELRSALDHAEAFVAAARALNIPARVVTGYLVAETEPPASGPHVWAEAYDQSLGWVGFDPMLDVCPTDRHVRVAIGLDGASTTPVRSWPSASDSVAADATSTEIVVAAEAAQ